MQNLKLKSHLIRLAKDARLYKLDIPIIGLTGGIACGKSTVAKLFKELGVLVINADDLIHNIYAKADTVDFIKSLAPDVIDENSINFKLLRSAFFNDSKLKETITNFLYKRLPSEFSQTVKDFGDTNFVVYDVPLLFENSLEKQMDFTITVSVSSQVQVDRLVKRDKIELDLAHKIIGSQMPIEQKQRLADYVLENNGSLVELETCFQSLTKEIFL
jgi:dephospho-CoA kinase